ncbi:MAG: hypothetical protein KF727_01970 [Microbacteriaceae bacterium]|nr:hypothetical protein [Microbacteriaceae bacterium]
MKNEYDDEEAWGPVEDLIAGLDLDPRDPLGRGGSDAAAGSRAVRWRDLPSDQARGEWQALRDWVEWVTVRFNVPLSLIPNCWWKHPALVEELSALHVAWRTAYDPQDSGLGPVMWLERWSAARPRLREAHTGSCSNGHKDPKRRSWADVTDQGEWDAWATDAHGD